MCKGTACQWPLTLSLPIPSRLYTLPYWSNLPFLIFDIRALITERQTLITERQSTRLNVKKWWVGPVWRQTLTFEQQQFGTASVEGVNGENLSNDTKHTKLLYLMCGRNFLLIFMFMISLFSSSSSSSLSSSCSDPRPVVDASHSVLHSTYKLAFLKVFPSIAIYSLLRLGK